MRRGRAATWGSFAALVVSMWAANARAQSTDAGTSEAREVDSLEAEIARDEAALGTIECTTACASLASMRRAAERLCALESGPRCAAARDKVSAASARVRSACPVCEAARESTAPEPAPAEKAASTPAAAPAGRGGCASCAVGGDAPSMLGLLGGLAAVSMLTLRRARRRDARVTTKRQNLRRPRQSGPRS